MQTLSLPMRSINVGLWSSRAISAVAVPFLVFDSVIKIVQHPAAVEPTVGFGFAAGLVTVLGVVELACLILYLIPRTSVVGAVLMTGYLGGAIATQVRVGAEPFSIVFPVIIGALLWGALYLRDERVRALLPFRQPKV